MFNNKSFAIDLGNNNTLLSSHAGTQVSLPSYIVFDSRNRRVKAVGDQAYEMYGRNHEDLRPVKPLQWGVIADYESASSMIREMVDTSINARGFFNRFDEIVSGVPYATTEVERRALRNVLEQFNPRKRYLLFEPLAAAMGMGLNITEPEGKMIIDIGGGITEVVVISLSGITTFRSIRIAGDQFTQDVSDYLRKKYNLMVGWKTAERLKETLGLVVPHPDHGPLEMAIKGKDMQEGLPVSVTIRYAEIAEALENSFTSIETCIMQVLDECSPELVSDICQKGMYVTGGGALLRGVASRLTKTTGLPVHIDQDPLLSVSRGISKVLKQTNRYQSILLN
jgi:rod shape-determining protein MreB